MNNYTHISLDGRVKLTYDWIPNLDGGKKINRLLDIGCSKGYGTNILSLKSQNSYGVDINAEYIEEARVSYPQINFENCSAGSMPYSNEYFNAIVLSEVLEHVSDEYSVLNEIHRVLKNNGTLILTVPHKGLFSFMDIVNYVYFAGKYFRPIFKLLFRMLSKRDFESIYQRFKNKHRHYSLKDLLTLLDETNWAGQYEITQTFRSALFLKPFVVNICLLIKYFSKAIRWKALTNVIPVLGKLSTYDYWISYGALSYCIALKINKLPVAVSKQ